VKEFIGRVIEWNKQRYNTNEINVSLRNKLLREECGEATLALINLENGIALVSKGKSNADTYLALKAHAAKEQFDVIFVAVGTLANLGFSEDSINQILLLGCDSNDSRPNAKLELGEKGVKGPSFVPAEPAIAALIEKLEDLV